MIIASATHQGNIRDNNEDACYSFKDSTGGLCIVADGMGGHNAGEVASGMAIDAVVENLWNINLDSPFDSLTEAFNHANIVVYGAAKGEKNGMGTTLTAAVMRSNMIYIAHVGDSRAYLYSGGRLRQLTTDHTLVQEMVDSGRITEKEARSHPLRHIITRAVGTLDTIEIDTIEVPWKPGDRLLLCSDGLTGELTDTDIERMLGMKMCKSAVNVMLSSALERGGHDNITILLAENTDDTEDEA